MSISKRVVVLSASGDSYAQSSRVESDYLRTFQPIPQRSDRLVKQVWHDFKQAAPAEKISQRPGGKDVTMTQRAGNKRIATIKTSWARKPTDEMLGRELDRCS